MWAQYNLGLAYEAGEGVPRDLQVALKWYRLSADQGDSEAQVRMGYMYKEGIGVAQDKAEAIKWYKLAAAQNNPKAREALAWLSENINNYAFIMPVNSTSESRLWTGIVPSAEGTQMIGLHERK